MGESQNFSENSACWLSTLKIFKVESVGVNNGDSRGQDALVGCREPYESL
jgi:hypothetical protein